MAKRNITADEQKLIGPDAEDYTFVTSAAWRRIKQRLLNKLVESDSVSSIDFAGKSDAELMREVVGRAHANTLIFDWIRDVENTAAIHVEAAKAMREVREDILLNLDERSED